MASSTSLSVSRAGRNGVRRKDAMIREAKTNNLDFIAGKLTPCARGNRQRHARLLCDQLPFVRSLIVCAIRDDRAVVFDQLHDVAVFGLMVDVMRGKARRWSESVISRELKCSRRELKLFDAFDFRNPTQMPCNCQTTSAPFYYSVHLHGLIVARNKGKRAIDKRGQPL